MASGWPKEIFLGFKNQLLTQHCPVPLIQRCTSSNPKDSEVRMKHMDKTEKTITKQKTLLCLSANRVVILLISGGSEF